MSYTDQFPNIQAIMLDKIDNLEKMLYDLSVANKDKNGMDKDTYLTVETTAKFLDCSNAYVYTLKAKIPHMIRGARLYFKKSDLIDYMEKGRVVPDLSKRTSRRR